MLRNLKWLIYLALLIAMVSFVHSEQNNHRLVKEKKRKKPLPQQPAEPHSLQYTPVWPPPFQYTPELPRPSSFYDPLVDYFLKNKIILCTGPSLGRYEMLKRTVEDDLKLIPFKKIFITTNDSANVGITFNEGKVIPAQCYLIPDKGQAIDCANCIISTMRHAVNHPEVQDDDIILFKHESVYINDMELISRAINKMVNEGYDMVNRRLYPSCWNFGIICTDTDTFFVKVSAIREIIKDSPDIIELPPHQSFCELYFHENIVKYIPNAYSISYCHNNGGPTELGFYHYAKRNQPFWDRTNYDQLYIQPAFEVAWAYTARG